MIDGVPAPSTLTLSENGTIRLRCSYYLKDLARSVPGYRWRKDLGAWEYPLSIQTYDRLMAVMGRVQVSPKLSQAVKALRAKQEEAEALKRAGKDNPALESVQMAVRTTPYGHQKLAYKIATGLPCSALLMEQGTGKTLVAIATAGRRLLDGEIERLLVVAPLSVLPVWASEFEKHAAYPYELQVLDGLIARREAALETMMQFPEACLRVAVVNYEATWRMDEALRRFAKGQMVVLDESQKIKTPSARQSKACHKIGQQAKYRMILTGTPVTQSPLDFFSQYKFLDPAIFGNSYIAFRNRYAIMGGYGGYEVVGYRDLEDLVEKAHSIAYRCRKSEALDLPPETTVQRFCDLGPAGRRVYEELRREAIAALSEEEFVTAPLVITRLLRLSQVAGGFATDETGKVHLVDKAKLLLLCEVLEEIGPKKTVIFARFLPELHAIREIIKQQFGKECLALYGETKDRGDVVKRFQEEADVLYIVVQVQTGGLGITLHAADTAVFYSTGYSYAEYEQCKARIHRAGQERPVTYVQLVARDTVDERVYEAIEEKRNIADLVVDKWQILIGGKNDGACGSGSDKRADIRSRGQAPFGARREKGA